MDGTVIDGKYRVAQLLGQGGMGSVYAATQVETNRRVALKVVSPESLGKSSDSVKRFEREARANGTVDSPHVVQMLDAGIDPATRAPYMVMELLEGEDLQQLVERLGPLPPQTVLRIFAQAASGLERAHEAGIVHRDIKAANLFLADAGADERIVKILDFGIAKMRRGPMELAETRLTRSGMLVGSPAYMSPEQAVGSRDLGPSTDIYSLGVTMYEALSGSTPHAEAENLGALVMAICSKEPRALEERAPWVPAAVRKIVARCLAKTPEQRFASASDLRRALVSAIEGAEALDASMFIALNERTRLPLVNEMSMDTTMPSSMRRILATSSAPVSYRSGAMETPAKSEVTPPSQVFERRKLLLAAIPVTLFVGALAALATRTSAPNAVDDPSSTSASGPPQVISAAPSADSPRTFTATEPTPPPSAEAPVTPTAPSASASARSVVTAPAKPTTSAAAHRPAMSASPATAPAPAPKDVTPAEPLAKPATEPPAYKAPTTNPCDPPFTVDARGHQHFKIECMSPKK